MRVQYLGKLADISGMRSEDIALPAAIADTSALRSWLDETRGFHGQLLHHGVRTAVNNAVVPDPFPVANEDEIALMPPVSGG